MALRIAQGISNYFFLKNHNIFSRGIPQVLYGLTSSYSSHSGSSCPRHPKYVPIYSHFEAFFPHSAQKPYLRHFSKNRFSCTISGRNYPLVSNLESGIVLLIAEI